jgi:hypothetical protein
MDDAPRCAHLRALLHHQVVGQGTGLGLSVVHASSTRTRRHRRRQRPAGQPASPVPAAGAPAIRAGSEWGALPPASRAGQHVLVRRRRGHGRGCMQLLQRLGYRVSGHLDPRKPRRCARAPQAVDLVLSDFNMPRALRPRRRPRARRPACRPAGPHQLGPSERGPAHRADARRRARRAAQGEHDR